MTTNPLTLWHEGEKAIAPGSAILVEQANCFELPIPPSLPFRRVYLFLEPKLSAGVVDFYAKGTLSFMLSGGIVAQLPASIGVNSVDSGTGDPATLMPSCAAQICSVSVSPIGPDCITLNLSKLFRTTDRQLLISPTRICARADVVRFGITSVAASGGNVENFKVWLGVLSSDEPL